MNGEIRRLQDRRRELTDLWDTQFNAGQWDDADRTMAAIRKLIRLIADLAERVGWLEAALEELSQDSDDAWDQLERYLTHFKDWS